MHHPHPSPPAVFDVDDDQARAAALGMEVNGFSFEGMDAPGMDYALNRWAATHARRGAATTWDGPALARRVPRAAPCR